MHGRGLQARGRQRREPESFRRGVGGLRLAHHLGPFLQELPDRQYPLTVRTGSHMISLALK